MKKQHFNIRLDKTSILFDVLVSLPTSFRIFLERKFDLSVQGRVITCPVCNTVSNPPITKRARESAYKKNPWHVFPCTDCEKLLQRAQSDSTAARAVVEKIGILFKNSPTYEEARDIRNNLYSIHPQLKS